MKLLFSTLALLACAVSHAKSSPRELSFGRRLSKSGGKMSSGTKSSKSSGLTAPRCEDLSTKAAKSTKASGKMSGGKMSSRRFLAYIEDQEGQRGLRANKGSKSSGKGGTKAPSVKAPKASKASGGGDTACANCGVTKDTCIDNEPLSSSTTVKCGDRIPDYRILKTSLTCLELGSAEPAIIVDGPDAVLECTGDGDNLILGRQTSSGTIGILLRNGGTAINCDVSGFGEGIRIIGDGNGRVIGGDIYDVGRGIVIQRWDNTPASGCIQIECVDIFNTDNQGIWAQHNGTLTVINTKLVKTGRTETPPPTNPGTFAAVELSPQAGNTLEANFEDLSIQLPFGPGLQLSNMGGQITEVNFFKSNSLYAGRPTFSDGAEPPSTVQEFTEADGILVQDGVGAAVMTNFGNLKVQQFATAFNNKDANTMLMLPADTDTFFCGSTGAGGTNPGLSPDIELADPTSIMNDSGPGGLRCDSGPGSFCFAQNMLASSLCDLVRGTSDEKALACSPFAVSTKAPSASKAPKSPKTSGKSGGKSGSGKSGKGSKARRFL